MEKSRNRRSMRRRIRNSLIKSSVVSNLIMVILVLLLAAFVLNSVGFLASSTIANTVAGEVGSAMYMNKGVVEKDGSFDMSKQHTLRWLYSVVGRYYFSFGEGFKELAEEEFLIAEVNMDTSEVQMYKPSDFELQLVYIDIQHKGESLVSTFPKDFDMKQAKSGFMERFWHEAEASYTNMAGEPIGNVVVAFNPSIIFGVMVFLVVVFGFASLFTMFVSILMASPMTAKLTRPIRDLQKKLDKMVEGDFDHFASEIELARPVREIEDLAASVNQIFEQMRAYSDELEAQKMELEAQNEELGEKSDRLAEVNHSLERVNIHMKDILDNVGQGFMRFERDLKIHSECSTECHKLFDRCIAGFKMSEIIYGNDSNQANFMDELLMKIMDPENSQPELYVPLLPDEIETANMVIEIEYRISTTSLGKRSMIVILTDITEKRYLEAMMDKERRTLKMVVKALVNRKTFMEVVESFEDFLGKWSVVGGSGEENLNFAELMRELHTFKGNFSQFDVTNLTGAIHQAENRVMALDENSTIEAMRQALDETKLREALRADMDCIHEYVGDDFLVNEDMYLVEKDKILAIEKKIQSMLSEQECRVLLPEIRSLRYRPLAESLRMYPEYVLKLSERLGKLVATFDVEGDDIFIDEERYRPFFKSLVHVFRNAVDHGLETPDDRVEQGKPQVGQIACELRDDQDAFTIVVSDDGQGVDLDQIRNRWQELGNEDMAGADEETLLMSLFSSNFTTQDEVSVLSGRGVGLAAVKEEVDALSGTVRIETKPGAGTRVVFTMPKLYENEERMIIPNIVMNGLTETAQHYFNGHVLDLPETLPGEFVKTDRIELHRLTALVSLKGVVNSIIMFSVNRNMGERMVKKFLFEPVDPSHIEQYVEDVLSEVANTILGNTLGKFEAIEDFLHMGIPAIISNDGAYVKYSDAEIMTYTFVKDDLEWSIHMIQLESNQVEEASLWQES